MRCLRSGKKESSLLPLKIGTPFGCGLRRVRNAVARLLCLVHIKAAALREGASKRIPVEDSVSQ